MTFLSFISSLNQQIGILLPANWESVADEIGLAQQVLERINQYFFQTFDGIGSTILNDKEYQYFSEYHKFWEAHHKEVLNAEIDRTQARIAANALHNAFLQYGSDIFKVNLDTHGLSKQAIAQVRFFTANQDFRIPPEDQFSKYQENYMQFNVDEIAKNPAQYLNFLGVSSLSQTDKRFDYAKNAAEFLIRNGINAYQIAEKFNNDASKIRQAFLDNVGMGYGRKKTDMFIRDMFVLDVWPNLSNMDVIDVASDRNTMKLALRTGILKTNIPLLSSFLDIFGYQYEYIDDMSAKAWRVVWDEWKTIDPNTARESPCMMDFLLYRIGREYCEDKLVEFICENNHHIFHFGAGLKLCPECRSKLTLQKRHIPCQVQSDQLPCDEAGSLRLKESNLLRTFHGTCILESVCKPKSTDFKKLSPPKAISIIGRTGWTDSYAYKDEGGGGMMG